MQLNIDFFNLIFFSFSTISACFVIIAKNPLHSIIFLILVFCNVVLLLLMQEIEFLSMVFLIVYVGAIAVLFLFVVYMLNIKIIELSELNWQYLIGFFVSFFFIILTICGLYISNFLGHFSIFICTLNYEHVIWSQYLYNFNNIQLLANVLYLDHFLLFIFLSLILLVAMVGAIILTTKKTLFLKEQVIFEQNFRKLRSNKAF